MEIQTENDVAKALGLSWATIRGWQEDLRVVPAFSSLHPQAFYDWCSAVHRRGVGRLTASEIRHFQVMVILFAEGTALLDTLEYLMEKYPEIRKDVRHPQAPEVGTAVNRLVALTQGIRKNGSGK